MHPVLGLLQYIPYNLILNRIISGRWGPSLGTLAAAPQNVNFMPANFVAPLSIPEDENWVTSQCPEFYAEDALMLSQVIYLGLLWLGLIVLLNPGVTIGKFTKKYLKPRWWLIINSMWIWVVIPHHLETASYYPVIFVTLLNSSTSEFLEEVCHEFVFLFSCSVEISAFIMFICISSFLSFQFGLFFNFWFPSPAAVVETGSSVSYFRRVMSFWRPDYFPAPPTDEISHEVLSALSFYSGSNLSHKSQVYHVMTKVSKDAREWLLSAVERNPRVLTDSASLYPLLKNLCISIEELKVYRKLYAFCQGTTLLLVFLPQFLTYCRMIDVPEVNKLSALWLAVDQTAQDLAVWDSPLTTTEALVSQILSLVSNPSTSKQGMLLIEDKPAARSWFSGPSSVAAPSSQSQDCSSCSSSQLQLAVVNKPVHVTEAPVVSSPNSSLAMLQHVIPTKPSEVVSEELPLVPIDCNYPVLPAAVQEMIKQYFQEHPASLAAVRTTKEKQIPAEIATFAANKSTSGYFLFYGNIDNGQTIYWPAILLDTGASENFMSVETADLLQLKYHPGMLVRGGNCQTFPSFQLKKPVTFVVAGQSFTARFLFALP
ncbi:hypothetical protein DSO57_1015582 [Entomophthora muscae]|uniref:Uncharacterized protein n=1 Tax=Entomophthora muscae TaxID=34485 RepID=A0ACC2TSH2_9FUNG|nr:hypothetical protein DSO57_1015582 [Entomophthora muscae]